MLKIIILCIWCNRIYWDPLMLKKLIVLNTVHYCRSSMPRLSQTLRFLQSPSFRQAQSALIGQLTQCIVIGRTPQARVGNVTHLTIIPSFRFQVRFTINSSPKMEQSRMTDTVMMLVCVCRTQAWFLTGCTLRCDVTLFPSLTHTHTHTHTHTTRYAQNSAFEQSVANT